jgi:hypothetical protein
MWNPMDLGVCKQKVLTKESFVKWWLPGVHQVVVWVGTARTGVGAKKKRKAKDALLGKFEKGSRSSK